jgi:hypothetical protein
MTDKHINKQSTRMLRSCVGRVANTTQENQIAITHEFACMPSNALSVSYRMSVKIARSANLNIRGHYCKLMSSKYYHIINKTKNPEKFVEIPQNFWELAS